MCWMDSGGDCLFGHDDSVVGGRSVCPGDPSLCFPNTSPVSATQTGTPQGPGCCLRATPGLVDPAPVLPWTQTPHLWPTLGLVTLHGKKKEKTWVKHCLAFQEGNPIRPPKLINTSVSLVGPSAGLRVSLLKLLSKAF